jgi:hypothetical protein
MPPKSAPRKSLAAPTAAAKAPAAKPARREGRAAAKGAQPDPTTDEALLRLDPSHAGAPDMPVSVAQREIGSIARLAGARAKELAKVGIDGRKIESLERFGARLLELEKAWQRARRGVRLTAGERKQLAEAEALDAKLLAGGRWACRDDEAAQAELSRIAEGAGLSDTIQDLRDLAAFWGDHAAEIARTKINKKDLARALELADALEPAAEKEEQDAAAACALELRNRCFWAADALAKEIREGGRYAFDTQPKIAAKFVSRYRTGLVRRSRRKAKDKELASDAGAPPAAPKGS